MDQLGSGKVEILYSNTAVPRPALDYRPGRVILYRLESNED